MLIIPREKYIYVVKNLSLVCGNLASWTPNMKHFNTFHNRLHHFNRCIPLLPLSHIINNSMAKLLTKAVSTYQSWSILKQVPNALVFWDGTINRILVFKFISVDNTGDIWTYALHNPVCQKERRDQTMDSNEVKGNSWS